MSDRIFAKAQSEGWTDLFVNEGKVWGYQHPSDVMPQQYPHSEKQSRVSGHVGISCRAVLAFQGQSIHGTYNRPSAIQTSRIDTFGWMLSIPPRLPETFIAERIPLDALSIFRPLYRNAEPFDARITLLVEPQYQDCLEWIRSDIRCLATRMECSMVLDGLSCSAEITILSHTAHTPAAIAQPAPMQHPQP
jgi:hypothetical protein